MIQILKAVVPHLGALFKFVELIVRKETELLDEDAVKEEIKKIQDWAKQREEEEERIFNPNGD